MSSPQYKVRSALMEPLGVFTKKEILDRIKRGKYKGDEEIAVEPFERWQKLASHPTFYDAFLKKLFNNDYHSPDGNEPESAPKSAADSAASARDSQDRSRIDRATRQGERGKTRAEPHGERDDLGKTRRIDGDRMGGGGTIQQEMIDELFSEAGQSDRPEDIIPDDQKGTDLIKIEGPMIEPTMKAEMPLPMDVGGAPTAEENEDVVARKKKRDFRRKILWGAVAAGLLFAIFQMGKDTKPDLSIGEDDPYSLHSRPHPLTEESDHKEERIKSLVDEADILYGGDTKLSYLAALEVYRDALGYGETSPILLGKVAETGARLIPDYAKAETLAVEIGKTIDKGRLSDPQSTVFFRTEALTALGLGKLEDAKKAAQAAIETNPDDGETALVVGEVNYVLGDLQGAKQALEGAVRALPGSTRAHYLLARTSLDLRDVARARLEGVEALKVNPIHPPTYLLLGEIALEQGQPKEAKGLFETCGRLARFTTREITAKAYYRLGQLYESAGNAASAQNTYRLAWYYYPDVDSSLAPKVKNLDLSKPVLEKLAGEAEYGKAYFHEQGEGLIKQGKLIEGMKFFQAAWFLDPKDGEALLNLGEITEKTAGSYEDFRRVMNLYERAIEKAPRDARAYIKLGSLETEQYNLDRAYKLLTQAAALAPQEADTFVALGKHFYKRQDYNEALNQFLKAAKINPADSEILYYAGMLRLLFKKDGAREAIRFFYQAYTIDSTNYDSLVEWLKLKVVNYEKNFAIKFVRNLLEAEPKNPKLYWAMGEVYSTAKEFRRAIDNYHKSLDLENRDSKVRMSLAKALESVGDLDKAIAEYRLSSLLDRRNSDGFYHAADLHFQMKNYNGAEEVLKYLVSVTPNYPGAHRYLSKIFQIRRQKDQAIAAMQKEVENNPENYKYVVEIAELYMDYEQWDKAVAELRRVANLPSLTKAPEYVYDKIRGYLLLSRCYRALNKPESAEATIKLALEIDNSDPELHKELGYVYYALQRDKEGVREFEYYLARNPAARDGDAVKALIQKMMIEE